MNVNSELEYVKRILSYIEDDKIRDRLENLLFWDISRAILYKKLYYGMNIALIVINASIPILNQVSLWGKNILVVSIISAFASVIASILTLVSIKDNWIRYRQYAEKLKTECVLFINKCAPYNYERNRENLFVCKIEAILSDEVNLWEATANKDKDKDKEKDKEDSKNSKASSEAVAAK